MVKILYLVRHGETGGDDKRRYKGSLDVPLSEIGEEQIKRTALTIETFIKRASKEQKVSYLAEIHGAIQEEDPETVIYCSTLKRAHRSAEIIGERLGVRPLPLSELRERSFGLWEGLSFDEIKERYPTEFDQWASNPLRFSPPQGESTLDVKRRVIPALRSILNARKSGNIIIAAHGGVNRVIICHLAGIPLKNIFRIEQSYGCVNVIEFWRRYPVIKAINYV
jgi:broad specificity phosphatase PhoE